MAMKGSDMVDLYFKHKGLKRISGESLEPVLPFFIGDVIYSIYNETVVPLKCKQMMKVQQRIWRDNYNEFNRDFFKAFNEEQMDEVIDKMDEFEAYIHNYVTMAKVAVMDYLPSSIPVERQKVLADLMLCNILAQSATIVWSNVYKSRSEHKVYTKNRIYNVRNDKSDKNPNLEAIIHATYKMVNLYHKGSESINCNESEKIAKAVDVLCHKIIYWLVYDMRKEKDGE